MSHESGHQRPDARTGADRTSNEGALSYSSESAPPCCLSELTELVPQPSDFRIKFLLLEHGVDRKENDRRAYESHQQCRDARRLLQPDGPHGDDDHDAHHLCQSCLSGSVGNQNDAYHGHEEGEHQKTEGKHAYPENDGGRLDGKKQGQQNEHGRADAVVEHGMLLILVGDGKLEDVFRERGGSHHDGTAHRGHDGGEHGGKVYAAHERGKHLGNKQRNDHVGVLHFTRIKHHVTHHAGSGQRPGKDGGEHHAYDHGHTGGAHVAHGEYGHALLGHGYADQHGDGEDDEKIGPAHLSAARDVEQTGIHRSKGQVDLGEKIGREAAEGRMSGGEEDGYGAEHHDDALNEVGPYGGEVAAHDAVDAYDDGTCDKAGNIVDTEDGGEDFARGLELGYQGASESDKNGYGRNDADGAAVVALFEHLGEGEHIEVIEGHFKALTEHAEGEEIAERRAYAHGERGPARVPGHARAAYQLDAALPRGGELEGREPWSEALAAEKVILGVLDPAGGKVTDEQHEAEIDDENGDHHGELPPSVPLVFAGRFSVLEAPPDAVADDEDKLYQKSSDIEEEG